MFRVATASRDVLRMDSAVAVLEAMPRIPATPRFQRVTPLVLAALLWCSGGLAQVIQQFPTALRPSSIALGPDGAMWFTQEGPKISRIDASGVATDFPLPAIAYAIALGSDGNLWVTTSTGIGRMTPAGAFTLFPVARTAGAFEITSGPDGNLWFTKFADARIGRITTSGEITEFPLPTNSLPRKITGGPDGNIWFTKPDDRIGRITPAGVVTEFATPTSYIWPLAIAAGPDGNVWFTESYPGVGRITPAGAITEFPVSDLSALTAGADGNLWGAGFGTLKRITPGGSTTTFSIPTATDEWVPTLDMAAALDGSIWIADHDNSQIIRFSQAQATTCVADATTLCLNNGRFRVRADWRTRDGSNGQGRGVALTSDSGYFWFFDAANVEVVVKVLNGCGSSSRYWTFAGGLTDVNVILTVTDTQTGVIKTYTNPLGTPFQPIQDTDAFATCP
jgi:streptogramin lyase